MSYIIGIDLGTTNSAVAIYENDSSKIITNSLGKRTTPSVVALNKKGSWVVGDTAKNQAITNAQKTLYGIKRLIGRRFDDPEVTKMAELSPYKIVKGDNGDAWVEIDGKAMAPAEISAKILRDLKSAVEKYLGEEVTEAVVTVPAYFNDAQRQATKNAGKIAGLDIKRIINEPTAAALAYGMDKKKNGKVIVYDLGGGTFDISVLDIDVDEDGSTIEVLSTNGDTFLGGENFDERIIEHLAKVLEDETGLKTKGNTTVLQRLKDAAEKAKIELSTQEVSSINLPFIGMDEDNAPINFEYDLTRGKLEALVDDLIKKSIGPCKKALADAGLKASDIDDILLVGGQTRMPKVVETVKNFFGKTPRNDVNPDEIVSMGASIQGAVLDGKVENILLLDVIPLSIGIRTAGDVMLKMIERNSTIPTEARDEFSTARDNQKNVEIMVYQGEREQASDNKLLGKFVLDGLPPMKAGEPKIEVKFDIDADGVLNVSAKDLNTGREQKIIVEANGGLSESDVERMLKDAQDNAEADKSFKLVQVATANATTLLKDAAEDTEEEYFKSAPADLKTAFSETVDELTKSIKDKDVEVMVEKAEKLQELRSAIGKAFQEASSVDNSKNKAKEDAVKAPTVENNSAKPNSPDAPST